MSHEYPCFRYSADGGSKIIKSFQEESAGWKESPACFTPADVAASLPVSREEHQTVCDSLDALKADYLQFFTRVKNCLTHSEVKKVLRDFES